jgi:hypothetical protein
MSVQLPKAAFSKKYLELDSTYRNRNQYPNPADFVVPYQISGSYNDCVKSFDPVCYSAPFEQGTGASLTAVNTVTLIPLVSSSVDNFYINHYIGLINTAVTPRTIQYSKITNYVGATLTVTVSGTYTLPLGLYQYVIVKQLPVDIPFNTNNQTTTILTMTRLIAFTPTVVTLQPTSSSTHNYYYGMMIRLTLTATGASEYRKITEYDETTQQITVSSPFSQVYTNLDYYEILMFSYDNLRPLKYQGTTSMNQPVCYAVRLVHICIPFVVRSYLNSSNTELDERAIIDVANGGTIDQYPFFYILLYSDVHRDNIQSLISNNPSSNYAVFRVPVSSGDTPGPKKIMSQTTFTRCDMCPVIKFLPNDTFHMSIMLPNGELLSFRQKDTVSPMEPNYKLQISAVFELTRLE